MPAYEIVDPSRRRTRDRRHVLLRLGGPVLGVLAVIAAIVATAMHSYTASREGALSLSRKLLESQRLYITQEVTDYLAPAWSGVIIAHDLLHAADPAQTPQMFADFSISTLRHVPQAASLYLADARGQFWLVERDRDGGPGWETTHLETQDGARIFRHSFYGADGHLLKVTTAPAGSFDPMREVWFRGAADQPGVAHGDDHLFWSRPYPFPPTSQPIVTSSLAYREPDGTVAVLAMNILIEQMSTFLEHMDIGRSGRAIIVDGDGRVIAGPGMPRIADPATWEQHRVRIDPDRQPVFARALAMYHVYGPGGRGVTIRGERYVTIAADVPLTNGNHWILLLNAPARDFAGFAIAARRQTLILSIVTVALASGLALFLILQERKTDRVQGRLDGLRAANERRHHALHTLAGARDLFDPTHDVPGLTEAMAEIAQGARASVWRLLDDGARLVCEDSFERDRDAHGTGMELSGPEFAPFLEMIRQGRRLDLDDAARQDALRGFYRIVMRPAGLSRLLVEPVAIGDDLLGCAMIEDAREGAEAEPFLRVIADLLAMRQKAAQERAEAVPAGDPAEGRPAPRPAGSPMLGNGCDFLIGGEDADEAAGAGEGRQEDRLPAGRYAMVPVLMIMFEESAGTYGADPRAILPVVQRVADSVQDIGREHGMFAVRVVGRRLLAIGSCAREPDPEAAIRVADTALAIREACLSLFAEADINPIFRMGIDVGQAFGTYFGREPRVFNLWGESIAGAEMMAEAAPQSGTIQVSEAAYGLLRAHYLFRPRGTFYRPHQGITRSFVLAGRR